LTWLICLKCRHFRGLNADGTVECVLLGETRPKLLCANYEPEKPG
jgi:hypothetical protein